MHALPLAPSQVSIQDACVAVTLACVELSRRGCLVLSAHALPNRPRVRVLIPAASSGLRGVARRWDRLHTLYAADLDGVQVEWCIRRPRPLSINPARAVGA
jgi:hypothetical protein